jgi:hypothetical protein
VADSVAGEEAARSTTIDSKAATARAKEVMVMIRLRGLALQRTVVRKGCARPEGGLNRSENAVAPRTARLDRPTYHRTHE